MRYRITNYSAVSPISNGYKKLVQGTVPKAHLHFDEESVIKKELEQFADFADFLKISTEGTYNWCYWINNEEFKPSQ